MLRLFMALILLLPIQAIAISSENPLPDSSKPVEYSVIKGGEHQKVEIQAILNTQQIEIFGLKEQFSIVREYNDDFLAVVLWSLGVVLTLTIVLLGFNWFQNTRAIRREFDLIKTEIHSSISLSKQDLKYEIQTELEKIEKNLDEKSKIITNKAVAPLKNKLKTLEHEILMLEYERLEAEVKDWKRQIVLSNALRCCSELIQCALKIDWDWKLSSAVDLMNEIFDEIDKQGVKVSGLDAQDIIETEAIIEMCPDSHKSLRDSLLNRLRALQ